MQPSGRGRPLQQSLHCDRLWEAAGKTWQLPFVGGDLLNSEGGFKDILQCIRGSLEHYSGPTAPDILTLEAGEHGEERQHRQPGLEALLVPTAKC